MATAQQCPSETALERLAAGAATRDDLRSLIPHLLRGCPACAARIGELLGRPVPEGAYDAALDRFEEGLRTALQAPAGPVSRLWSVVQGHPAGRPCILSDLSGRGPEPAAEPPPREPAPQPPPPSRIPLTVSERRSRSIGPSFK